MATWEETLERVVPAAMAALLGIALMAGVAQAVTPQPKYVCPICGAKFMTYDGLYQHFTTEHPAEPIEIIWQ